MMRSNAVRASMFVGKSFLRSASISQSHNIINFSKKPVSSLSVTSSNAVDFVDEGLLLGDVSIKQVRLEEPTILQRRVVVYDGVCHLCHRGVKWVIEADKDKKIKFCCLQSKAAVPYLRLCGIDREDVFRSFLFVEGPGLYHRGSTAALKVASYLPLPYSLLSALMIVPKPVREAVYDYVARRRYDWFGKGTNCLVLKEKELLQRFVDWDELLGRTYDDNQD